MRTPKIVGVLNITPDSFSDGGKFLNMDAALRHTEMMIQQGADIIDIGAESRRPIRPKNYNIITPEEEWSRLQDILPEVIKIAHANNVKVSIDSRRAYVIKRSIELGVEWINDASGFSSQEIINIVKDTQTKLVLMFHLSIMANHTTHVISQNEDPIQVIINWGNERISSLVAQDISLDRVVFDIGIGYGQTAEQAWYVLRNLEKIKNALGLPMYAGYSRKSFLSLVTDAPFSERDTETLAISTYLSSTGVLDYVRVHNVEMHKRSFATIEKFLS